MPETLFALDTRNYRDCQRLFRGDRNQEYYRGDFWVDDARPVDVCARKKRVGPYTIITTRAKTPQFFRRSQKHIREDPTDLSVLWFVRSGSIVFSNQYGKQEIGAGGFLISHSMSPFFIELAPELAGVHEVLHVTVPTHLLRNHIPREIATHLHISEESAELRAARNILSDLFADEGELAADSARKLIETALDVVGHSLRRCAENQPLRQSVAERRREDLLRFIEVHLCDANLCAAMVSKECGVGLRYLSLLLQETGQTFSELVWSQRMEMARKWLANSDPLEIAISEIAYGVGFKSPAHFSRMFKRVYKQNPRDYRARMVADRNIALNDLGENSPSDTLQ